MITITGTLAEVNSKLAALADAGIEVVAVSADLEDAATKFVAEKGLNFTIAYGLVEPQIRQLGLYVSEPTNYIPQTHRFSEPGYFFLTPDNKIKYVSISSHPMGGRINVDNLLAGFNWSLQEAKTRPEFASVVWGSAV